MGHVHEHLTGAQVLTPEELVEAHKGLDDFREKRGFFDNEKAWKFDLATDLVVWWGRWGIMHPPLKKLAMRVLDQPTSIGAAERAWKVYSFIHDKKKNRLDHERATKLVQSHWNLWIINDLKDPLYEPLCLPAINQD